jgi:MscS family membrane protein
MTSLLISIQLPFENVRAGNEPLFNILWCAGIIILTLLLKNPASRLITRMLCVVANRFGDKKDGLRFRELLRQPLELMLQALLYYIAINRLGPTLQYVIFRRERADKPDFEVSMGDVADRLFLFTVVIFATLIVSRLVDFFFHVQLEKAYEKDEKERQELLPLLKEVAKIILWTIGSFWILGSVFEVNIPALITGLGIGGVAIALAAKESVENFFASFTILTDKPFQTGNTVKLGNLEGEVERIGFRSTRLRSADGSLYIIPNKKLVNENLENLTQRDTRRVRIVVNIKYGLSHKALTQMTEELKKMIRATLHVNEPVEVTVEGFGENVFQLAISYHVPEPLQDGAKLGAIKQDINMRIYEIVSRFTTLAPGGEAGAILEEEEQDKENEEAKPEEPII